MVMDSQQQAMWQQQWPQLSNDRIDFTKHTVNTFIHFADQAEPPRPFGLDRSQTAPPNLQEFDGEHDWPWPSAEQDGPGCTTWPLQAQARCPSFSSSEAGEDARERIGAFDEAFHAPGGLGLSAAVSPAPSALGQQPPSQHLGGYGSTVLDHSPAHQRTHTGPSAPQPQTLICIPADGHNPQNNKYKVIWTVDGRKLNSNDKQAVSPPFELRFSDVHPLVTFKMIIYPREREGDGKGGASFKRSYGMGMIQLKCEGDLSNAHAAVAFQMAIGNANTDASALRPLNPITHNFAQSAVCGLPRASNDTWDFNTVVDHSSKTFTVHLDIKTEIIQI
jgi:hypothetical protein